MIAKRVSYQRVNDKLFGFAKKRIETGKAGEPGPLRVGSGGFETRHYACGPIANDPMAYGFRLGRMALRPYISSAEPK